jgi:hypothetical protein
VAVPSSPRHQIRLILESDESYDEDPQGDPPITVPRYRRALRAALSIEPDDWEPPGPGWSEDARDGFVAGVRAASEAIAEEVARVLGAVPPPPRREPIARRDAAAAERVRPPLKPRDDSARSE